MNITLSPSRKQLAKLVLAKKPFLMKLPSVGVMVRVDYYFTHAILTPGALVGFANDNWFEVGQISKDPVWNNSAKQLVYYVNVIQRLTCSHGMQQMRIMFEEISCIFRIIPK